MSVEEYELVLAIQAIEYGELLEVEILSAPKTIEQVARGSFEKLLNIIRDGNPYLDSIKVHQGRPTQVLVTGMRGRLKYKKKIMLEN